MDGPGFSPESLTGFAAAGAQLMLFTTGAGNSFCSLLAPTIKISANRAAVQALTDQIDFDANSLLDGEGPSELADQLLARVVDTASGTLTWGEVLAESDECFARFGGSF
jgi:altronate dehydratase large subunit